MLKVTNPKVFNLEGAIRGMRFPMQSEEKSDSFIPTPLGIVDNTIAYGGPTTGIGPKDLLLARKLIAAGTDHSKFMRQILVSMDITAPLYWWKEFDTYKVATVGNSESTMHRLAHTPITPECFSFDSVTDDYQCADCDSTIPLDQMLCGIYENYRLRYLETGDKRYWRALIQLLPSGWNQKRHWTGNYATFQNLIHSRANHKLIEWQQLIDECLNQFPYLRALTQGEK